MQIIKQHKRKKSCLGIARCSVLANQESCQCLISERNSSRLLGKDSTQATTSRHSFRISSPVKLGRRRSSNVQKKCFNPVCTARPTVFLHRPPPLLFLTLARGLETTQRATYQNQTGIFCRRSLVRAAALPLHLPSKAEHLGQGGFLLTDVHFRSVSCPSRLRQSGIVFPGVWTGKLSSLGIRCGRAKPSHKVRRGTSLSEEGEGYLSEAITNFSPLFANGTAPTGCAQRHMCVLTVCIGDPRPRPLRAVQVSSCTHEHCRAAPILSWS